jgi:hypothetical protein
VRYQSLLRQQCPSPSELYRLKRFDQSSASSRKGSETPRSVVGIGNKGMVMWVFYFLVHRHPSFQSQSQTILKQKSSLRW